MSAKNLFYSKERDFTRAETRAFAREELAYKVTEDLLVLMEDMGVSKIELSRRLGKSRSYVTQILGGSRNMTLSSLSDICFALGFKPDVVLPVSQGIEKLPDWEREPVKKGGYDSESVIVEKENIIHLLDHPRWSTKSDQFPSSIVPNRVCGS